MQHTMLDYGKIILKKVSFNEYLFWKEYDKFSKDLSHEENCELINWIAERYQDSSLLKIKLSNMN